VSTFSWTHNRTVTAQPRKELLFLLEGDKSDADKIDAPPYDDFETH